MPRVKIDTPGVTVEIEANEVSINELGEQALKLFERAGGWPQHQRSAFGFGAATERRWTPDHRHERYGGDFEQVTA